MFFYYFFSLEITPFVILYRFYQQWCVCWHACICTQNQVHFVYQDSIGAQTRHSPLWISSSFLKGLHAHRHFHTYKCLRVLRPWLNDKPWLEMKALGNSHYLWPCLLQDVIELWLLICIKFIRQVLVVINLFYLQRQHYGLLNKYSFKLNYEKNFEWSDNWSFQCNRVSAYYLPTFISAVAQITKLKYLKQIKTFRFEV